MNWLYLLYSLAFIRGFR